MNKKIAITTGDLLGIGEEVTLKALLKLNLPKDQVILIGHNLNLPYETIEIDDKDNGEFCFKSLEAACNLAKKGEIQGIVTAPVSKKVLNDSGYHFSGQTEILEHFLGNEKQKAEMLFILDDLRVMLLTRHIALKDIKITKEMISEKTKRFNNFLQKKCSIKSPKIAFCALNPHSGEEGILGDEEIKIINPTIKELQKEGISVSGAYPADALFGKIGQKYLKKEKQEFDGIISTYHDQGLCAIKALGFNKVVNTTIGLSVIRTSPPHGTAYDIKGKNIADESGMEEAIKLALKLSKYTI